MDEAVVTAVGNFEDQSALEEKFPRVAKALCELWGQEGYSTYLKSLVFDERGGRQGFPPDVSMELFTLYQMLNLQTKWDIWTQYDSGS